MSHPEPPMGTSGVCSFPVQSGGFLVIFQLFRCRNLPLNRMFPALDTGMGGCQLRRHPYTPYICMPPVHLYASIPPVHLYVLYHMYPICHRDLEGICTPHMSLGLLGGISTSVRHFCVCQYIHLPLSS